MADKYRATVKIYQGLTINLGAYESARIEAGVEIEGDRENLPELWEKAESEVDAQLNQQMERLEEMNDERKTLLGFDKAPKFN